MSDEEVRTSGSNKTGSNRDGGAMAVPGEARPRPSRRLANDQPCMLIHLFMTCVRHTITVHILSVLLLPIFPVMLMILRVILLFRLVPTLTNPLLVSALVLATRSDLSLELARITPVKAVIGLPALQNVRFPLGTMNILLTTLYRTACRLMTQVRWTLRLVSKMPWM